MTSNYQFPHCWNLLPLELKVMIFSYLDSSVLLGARMVSTAWLKLIPFSHCRLLPHDASDLERLLALFSKAETVTITASTIVTESFWKVIQNSKERPLQLDLSEINETKTLDKFARQLLLIDLYEPAVRVGSRLIQLEPKTWEWWRLRMCAYQLLNRFEDALSDATECTKLVPAKAQTHADRAGLLFRLARYEEAIDEANLGMQLNAGGMSWYYIRAFSLTKLDRLTEALDDFNLCIEMSTNANDPDVFFGRGCAYYLLDRHEEAIADFSVALKQEPSNAAIWARRGVCESRIGNFTAALADLNEAIRLSTDPDAQWFFQRGFIYELSRNYEEALKDYDRSFELNPNRFDSLYRRGILMFTLGHNDESLQNFNIALKLEPNDVSALARRGAVYERLGRREEAYADYRLALLFPAKVTRHHNSRGFSLLKLGRYEEALACFNKAIAEWRFSADYFEGRARTYVALGKLSDALKDFDRVLELLPEDAETTEERNAVMKKLQNAQL